MPRFANFFREFRWRACKQLSDSSSQAQIIQVLQELASRVQLILLFVVFNMKMEQKHQDSDQLIRYLDQLSHSLLLMVSQDGIERSNMVRRTEIAFTLIAIYLFSTLVLFAVSIAQNVQNSVASRATRLVITFHEKFGFISSIITLIQIIALGPSYFTDPTVNSFFTEETLSFAIALIVLSSLILIFGLSINSQPLLIDGNMFSSRKSNSIETIDICMKTLLAFNISGVGSIFENRTFISAVVLIVVVLKGIYLKFSLPYYSIEPYKIAYFGLSIEILFGLTSLTRSSLSGENINFISSFYVNLILAPIMLKLLWGYHFNRLIRIVTLPSEEIRSESTGLVRIGMITKILENAKINLKADALRFRKKGIFGDSGVYLQLFYGLLRQHCAQKNCEESCPCQHLLRNQVLKKSSSTKQHSKLVSQNTNSKTLNQLLVEFKYQYKVSAYQEMIKSVPNSNLLKLSFANFITESPTSATSQAISIIYSADGNSFLHNVIKDDILSKLEMRFTKKQPKSNLASDDSSFKVLKLKEFIDLDTDFKALKSKIGRVCQNTTKFWWHYKGAETTVKQIWTFGYLANKEAWTIEHKWNKLVKKYGNMLWKEYGIYGLYQLIIRNSLQKGNNLINQMNQKTQQLSSVFKQQSEINNTTIMDDKNLVLCIQMTGERIGEIFTAQGGAKEVSGYIPKELIGQDVSNLVPCFFRSSHSQIMRGLSKKLNEKIEGQGIYISSFLKTKEGYITPTNIYTKPNPYVKIDFSFIAIVRPVNTENQYLIVNKKGEVMEQSQGFIKSIEEKEKIGAQFLLERCEEFKKFNQIYNLFTALEEANISFDQVRNMVANEGSEEANKIINLSKIAQILNIQTSECITDQIFIPSSVLDYDNGVQTYLDLKERGKDLFISCPNSEHYDVVKFNCLIKEFKQSSAKYFKILELCEVYDGDSEASLLEIGRKKYQSLGLRTQNATLDNLESSYINQPSTINEMDESCNVEAEELEDNYRHLQELGQRASNFDSNFDKTVELQSPKDSEKAPIARRMTMRQKKSSRFSKVHLYRAHTMKRKPHTLATTNQALNLGISDTRDEVLDQQDMKIFDLSSQHSSSKISQVATSLQIEKVIENRKLSNTNRRTYLFFGFFIALSLGLMIGLQQIALNDSEDIFQGTSLVRQSILREFSVIELNRRLYCIRLVNLGIIGADRQAASGVADYRVFCKGKVLDLVSNMVQLNNNVRKLIHKLDPELQENLYKDRITLYPGDNSTFIRELNSMDTITSFAESAQRFVDLPVDEFTLANAEFNYLLNNTQKEIIISSKRTTEVMRQQLEGLNSQLQESGLIFLICIVLLGFASSLIVVKESFDFSKKKYNFYINLMNLDDKATDDYSQEVNTFTALLEKDSQENLQEIYDKTIKYEKKSQKMLGDAKKPVKPAQVQRKYRNKINTNGLYKETAISITSVSIICLLIIIFFGVFYQIFIEYEVDIVEKVKLLIEFNNQYSEYSFAFSMAYSYVAENISTTVLDAPIEETFSTKLQYLRDTQDFYLDLEDLDPKFNQYLKGNLCEVYWPNALAACLDYADGAAGRGYIAMNGYLLASFEEVKSAFQYSDRTFEDQQRAMQVESLFESERTFGLLYAAPFNEMDSLIYDKIQQSNGNYQDLFKVYSSISFALTLILSLFIVFSLYNWVFKDRFYMKMLLKLIPVEILLKNKQMQHFLVKHSDQKLNLNRLQHF